jgi:hypothetical protein
MPIARVTGPTAAAKDDEPNIKRSDEKLRNPVTTTVVDHKELLTTDYWIG